ncbi:hypothetical protein [Nostoc sp. FACHB-888]|uniref:hypothetical protein n=1 Tax=Nostoc sp. FACHB-888 TaxID=2692842 RepID=UPI0016855228|nr:hypothetical protein [Nostoc sp. FACHB-888]MBD2248115.1 hypothetical protein [Nostoc sp. FACHB-888]
MPFTTEHLTILELLGGVKSYDYLPPGWKNVEVITDIAIVTPDKPTSESGLP